MSKTIDSFIAQLGVSRPVFRLTKDSYGYGRLQLDIVDPYAAPASDDIVQQLVNANHQEHFDTDEGTFSLATQLIKDATMGRIVEFMLHVIEHNLEIKKPRSSKLYRYFAYVPKENDELCEALVQLYRYSRSYADSNGYFKVENFEHMKNTLGILELLRKKYER